MNRMTKIGRRGRDGAFTLIELLVVISIIGILAALVLGVFPAIQRKKVLARVHTEVQNLASAIEKYKSDKNFYPPDNTNNFAQPPLAYELVGTTLNNATYTTLNGQNTISAANVSTFFKRDGFANSGAKAEDYHKNLKEGSVGVIPGSPDVRVLTVPYKGPNGDFNPFYYNSTNPEHNTESFDLWAVIVLNGQTYTIGNWKD